MRPGLILFILALSCSTTILSAGSMPNAANGPAQVYVSPTRYDYSKVAGQITAGCGSKYEQAEAIYRWLCKNISYDTSYSIYTADECWDTKSGVCQAYCELFYRLAEPIGLKTYIITGIAKGSEEAPSSGHAWIFAVTSEENTGILIDPTWGAGSVSGGIFSRKDNDMSWFHVDPRWMIFTHFPDDISFQMLEKPITREQYVSLPRVMPLWGEYGLDPGSVLDHYLSDKPDGASAADAPVVMDPACGHVLIREMPLESTLSTGKSYTFVLEKVTDCSLGIIDDKIHTGWAQSGDICRMSFTPAASGELSLSIKKDDGLYWSFVQYKVSGSDEEYTDTSSGNGTRISGPVPCSSSPVTYVSDAAYTVIQIPEDGILHAGTEYTFTIRPENKAKWAIIDGGTWHFDWAIDPQSGTISMTITPQGTGPLVIAADTGDTRAYSYCIEYKVE